MVNAYATLFSPIELGPKTARNRACMTAHAADFATDGTFPEASAEYYGERARGGIAMITMEAMAVHPTSQPRRGVIRAYDTRIIDSYRRVAAAVQPHGTLLIGQLWHRGRQTDGQVSRLPTWAPSPVPDLLYREIPHQLTVEEIDEVVAHYVMCARYAVEGGLDGIEVHGVAHGYLLGQFLSPATNHRVDAYGGSLDNRLHILRRIVDAVKEVVPDDRMVGMRINSNDGRMENGLGNPEWVEIAEQIASWQQLDYLSTSEGTYLDMMDIFGIPAARPQGYEVNDTANIKRAVGSLPVMVVGRITTPEMAEQVLASGNADLVGMARQLMADPMWAAKAEQGRSDDIRPCVGANWCVATQARGTPITCIHNAEVGREKQFRDMPRSGKVATVAVAGGGPAGLRAALTAAEKGHRVTLFEKSDRLGGQVNLITRANSFQEWSGVIDWLVGQLAKTNVDIKMQHEVVGASLLDDFDSVIVATGSTPLRHGWTAARPAKWGSGECLPGADQANVYTPFEVLGGGADLPHKIVVLDDTGDRQAFVVAEYLVDRGHDVTVVTGFPQIGHLTTGSMDQGYIYGSLRRRGVRFTPNVLVGSIAGNHVNLVDVHTRDEVAVAADAVVLVLGNAVVDGLVRELAQAEMRPETYLIGDAQAPRRIFNAIWEGEIAGRSIGEDLKAMGNGADLLHVASASAPM